MSHEHINFGVSTDDQLSSILRGSAVVHEESDVTNRVLIAARTRKSTGVTSAAPINVIDNMMIQLRNQLEKLVSGQVGTSLHQNSEMDTINFKIQLLQKVRRHRLVEQSKAAASTENKNRLANVLESMGRDDTRTDSADNAESSTMPIHLKTMHIDWNRHTASTVSDDEDDVNIIVEEEPSDSGLSGDGKRKDPKRRNTTQSAVVSDKDDESILLLPKKATKKTAAGPSLKKDSVRQISSAQKDKLLIGDDWDERVYTARLQEYRSLEAEQEKKIEALSTEAVNEAMDQGDPNDVAYLQSVEEQVATQIRQRFRPHTLAGGLQVPLYIWDQLLPYQKSGIAWMWDLHRSNTGGILGDEMGLGKTVQVAGFLGALEYNKLLRPSLVVCPATVIAHWVRELTTWWPPLRVYAVHESGGAMRSGLKAEQALKQVLQRVTSQGGVVLITYEGMRIHSEFLLRLRWGHIILDEGHKIRNPDAGISVAAKSMASTHRLILSGTPIQNHLRELWSLFDFIMPGKLGSLATFESQFSTPIAAGGWSNATPVQIATAYECALALKDLISPFLLRRLKKDVNTQLPKKTEQVLFCKLTPSQRSLYSHYLQSDEVGRVLDGKQQAFRSINLLRNLCNHAALFNPKESEKAKWNVHDLELTMETLVGQSGKMVVLAQILKMWRKNGNRCLIFTQGRKMLDLLEIYCKSKGYSYLRMDGTTSVRERQVLIDSFNGDARWFAFLATTRTGGIGVNLTGADRVVLFDPDWNPSTDAQSRERAWRLGQRRPVSVYRLITAGTIEEKVYQRQIYKSALSSKILSKDTDSRRLFTYSDLRDLFHLGDGIETVVPSSATLSDANSSFVSDQLLGSAPYMNEEDEPGHQNAGTASGETGSRTSVLQSVVDGASLAEFLPELSESSTAVLVGKQVASAALNALKATIQTEPREDSVPGTLHRGRKEVERPGRDKRTERTPSGLEVRSERLDASTAPPIIARTALPTKTLLPVPKEARLRAVKAEAPQLRVQSQAVVVPIPAGLPSDRLLTSGSLLQSKASSTWDPVVDHPPATRALVKLSNNNFGKQISSRVLESTYEWPVETVRTFYPRMSFVANAVGLGQQQSPRHSTIATEFPVYFYENNSADPQRSMFYAASALFLIETPLNAATFPQEVSPLQNLPILVNHASSKKRPNRSGTHPLSHNARLRPVYVAKLQSLQKSRVPQIVRFSNPLSATIQSQVHEEMSLQRGGSRHLGEFSRNVSVVDHSSSILAKLRERVYDMELKTRYT